MEHKGLAVFDFEKPVTELIGNLVKTAEMFGGVLYENSPKKFDRANLDFLHKYMGKEIKERKI